MRAARKRRAPAAPQDMVEVFDVEQGSDPWFDLRLGMPTASRFATIMANGKDGGESKTRQRLLYVLASEIISGIPCPGFESRAMRRGKEMEPGAIEHYQFVRATSVERVGFVRRTVRLPLGDMVVGCSPDGLVGADGVVQVKTMDPELLLELLDSGRFPTEHRAQCQGELWVTGRRWCDLLIFHESMPAQSPIFRIERDDAYIQKINEAVQVFAHDLAELVKRIMSRSR